MVTPRKIGGYGWRKDSLDPLDHTLALRASGLLPLHIDLRATSYMPPVYNQLKLGSCVGNGIGACVQYDRRKLGQNPDFAPSRLAIYYGGREIEGTTDIDAGTEIRDGMKVVAKDGVASEALWPYDVRKFAQKPSSQYYVEAEKHQVVRYARVSQNNDVLRATLAQGFPIVFGFVVYESFESDQVARTGFVPMPNPSRENLLGGHCVVLCGYTSRNLYIFRNSWGETWGDRGYGYMEDGFVTNTTLCSDFWVVTSVEA